MICSRLGICFVTHFLGGFITHSFYSSYHSFHHNYQFHRHKWVNQYNRGKNRLHVNPTGKSINRHKMGKTSDISYHLCSTKSVDFKKLSIDDPNLFGLCNLSTSDMEYIGSLEKTNFFRMIDKVITITLNCFNQIIALPFTFAGWILLMPCLQ